MPQSKFEVGDIVELRDGSIYILEEQDQVYSRWKITTIHESHIRSQGLPRTYAYADAGWLVTAKIMGTMEVSHGEDV